MAKLAKPCILAGSCPGDLGETEVLWFGEVKCVSKASAVVKLFGALEAAGPREPRGGEGRGPHEADPLAGLMGAPIYRLLSIHRGRRLFGESPWVPSEGRQAVVCVGLRRAAGLGRMSRRGLRLYKCGAGLGPLDREAPGPAGPRSGGYHGFEPRGQRPLRAYAHEEPYGADPRRRG